MITERPEIVINGNCFSLHLFCLIQKPRWRCGSTIRQRMNFCRFIKMPIDGKKPTTQKHLASDSRPLDWSGLCLLPLERPSCRTADRSRFYPGPQCFFAKRSAEEGRPRQAICPASDQTTSGGLQSAADLQDHF